MATLGQQLKAAREAKGISEHDAGTATRILTKTIVAMEADDFSGMAAPTYAKGFIRLYAQYLGLDPEPLVDEYLQRHLPQSKPRIEPPPSSKSPQAVRRISLPGDLAARLHPAEWLAAAGRFFPDFWKKVPPVKDIRVLAAAVAGALVLLVLIVSISNCARRHAAAKPAGPAQQTEAAPKLLDEPLPDLYLVEPGKIESSR